MGRERYRFHIQKLLVDKYQSDEVHIYEVFNFAKLALNISSNEGPILTNLFITRKQNT